MSCNHCNTKFNFFHKELGCLNCGLSFCNKCLKQKCSVPGKNNAELPVCRVCYTQLTTKQSHSDERPPPDIFLKRLEALENPSAPPITIYKSNKQLANLRTGLSAADLQLLDRLEKLKNHQRTIPPTEDELRKRLNNLKGENEYVEGPHQSQTLLSDTRSDQEKVDSLLEEFITEKDIELANNPEDEIAARIASLREQGVRPNEGPYLSNLHDSSDSSEDDVDKITKKIMDEVALEEKSSTMLPKQSSVPQKMDLDDPSRSSPELPWCVLCNQDATCRCLDCNDLYCSECNIEVHKSWGEMGHTVVSYKKK